jgi:hypothetical protein
MRRPKAISDFGRYNRVGELSRGMHGFRPHEFISLKINRLSNMRFRLDLSKPTNRGTALTPSMDRPRLAQLLNTPPNRCSFDIFRLTSNLQKLKRLPLWKGPDGQFLHLIWHISCSSGSGRYTSQESLYRSVSKDSGLKLASSARLPRSKKFGWSF